MNGVGNGEGGNVNGGPNGGGGNNDMWWAGLCVGLVLAGFGLVTFLAIRRGGEVTVVGRVDTPGGLGVTGMVKWTGS
jgi:hypothetical protein